MQLSKNVRRYLRYSAIAVGVLVVAFGVCAIAIKVYVAYKYPYGMSHCCDLGLQSALYDYAQKHEGWFPRGEPTPEGSLSLLFREEIADANLLRGKTVPEDVVLEILERGELLSPETCGWHYVEGLRADDNPKLAVFWDKEGLDHNGGRLAEGGHIVCFVGFARREHIAASDWDAFLAEQSQLLAERKPVQ